MLGVWVKRATTLAKIIGFECHRPKCGYLLQEKKVFAICFRLNKFLNKFKSIQIQLFIKTNNVSST